VTSASETRSSSDEAARTAYAELVRDAAAGDRGAMERLLIRAQEAAYRFSLLVCGHAEDAEDVMQDALLKTYQHVNQIADPSAFRTWLYTTVRNACLMKRRLRAGEPPYFESIDRGRESEKGETKAIDVPDTARPADERMMDGWIDRRLRKALHALPPAYRLIIVMREIDGLSTREVATVTGISEANVKQRLHRARVMLRRELEQS
jgi:RNA polymerase sigma-70 factor (ECF subfamily)